jgi:hypothetical protein
VFGAFARCSGDRRRDGRIRRAWTPLPPQRAQADNDALREEVADLRVKLQQARAEAAEAGNLRNLLALRDRSKMPTRAAEVIGTSATPEFRTVTIDRGSSDGIQRDMAVVGPAGAVGRVVMSSRGAAKVQLLIDRSAAAAVMVQRSRAQGIVFGTGEPLLRLDYLSTTADVRNARRPRTSASTASTLRVVGPHRDPNGWENLQDDPCAGRELPGLLRRWSPRSPRPRWLSRRHICQPPGAGLGRAIR